MPLALLVPFRLPAAHLQLPILLFGEMAQNESPDLAFLLSLHTVPVFQPPSETAEFRAQVSRDASDGGGSSLLAPAASAAAADCIGSAQEGASVGEACAPLSGSGLHSLSTGTGITRGWAATSPAPRDVACPPCPRRDAAHRAAGGRWCSAAAEEAELERLMVEDDDVRAGRTASPGAPHCAEEGGTGGGPADCALLPPSTAAVGAGPRRASGRSDRGIDASAAAACSGSSSSSNTSVGAAEGVGVGVEPPWPLSRAGGGASPREREGAGVTLLCPTCRVQPLREFSHVVHCSCGFRLDTREKHALSALRSGMLAATAAHSAHCAAEPSYRISSRFSIQALYLDCAACGDLQVVF